MGLLIKFSILFGHNFLKYMTPNILIWIKHYNQKYDKNSISKRIGPFVGTQFSL